MDLAKEAGLQEALQNSLYESFMAIRLEPGWEDQARTILMKRDLLFQLAAEVDRGLSGGAES